MEQATGAEVLITGRCSRSWSDLKLNQGTEASGCPHGR